MCSILVDTKKETSDKMPTEVVYVQDRKVKTKKEREIPSAITLKNNKKPKLITDNVISKMQTSKTEDKLDMKTNSSISSPLSITDSVITLPDSLENSCGDVPEKDPLAESDVEDKRTPKTINLGSFSLDYNDSSTPPPMPVFPFKRTLRKRGREASPQPVKAMINESKKMKIKGKRQVNTSLRKSVEEKKEQEASSSDDVQVVSETKATKGTPKKRQKTKSRKQKQKSHVKSLPVSEEIQINDDNEDSSEKNLQTVVRKNKQRSTDKNDKDETAEPSDEDSPVNSPIKPKPKGKNSK